jgi:hypothetical protein
MKLIRFTTSQTKYNAGETAGFRDDIADRLVKEGVAEHVRPKARETLADAPVEEVAKVIPEDDVDDVVDIDSDDDGDDVVDVDSEDDGDDVVDVEEEDVEDETPTEAEGTPEHRGSGSWYIVDADGEDLSGPYKRRELRKMGYDV